MLSAWKFTKTYWYYLVKNIFHYFSNTGTNNFCGSSRTVSDHKPALICCENAVGCFSHWISFADYTFAKGTEQVPDDVAEGKAAPVMWWVQLMPDWQMSWRPSLPPRAKPAPSAASPGVTRWKLSARTARAVMASGAAPAGVPGNGMVR